MNRYRTVPGLGPQRATATTTCQKCLKKDDYECKAGAQDRPYISRPSRTQQFLNPKLKPHLTNNAPDDLLQRQGVADKELAKAQLARDTRMEEAPAGHGNDSRAQMKRRSLSVSSSADSVSTISTNRSESLDRGDQQRNHHRSPKSKPNKRSHRELSQSSRSRSPSRTNQREERKVRRYRSRSPHDRGRSYHRNSHRSASRASSQDRSAMNKNRRSLDANANFHTDENIAPPSVHPASSNRPDHGRYESSCDFRRHINKPGSKKERSLSPYSRRLALTQAMNNGR